MTKLFHSNKRRKLPLDPDSFHSPRNLEEAEFLVDEYRSRMRKATLGYICIGASVVMAIYLGVLSNGWKERVFGSLTFSGLSALSVLATNRQQREADAIYKLFDNNYNGERT